MKKSTLIFALAAIISMGCSKESGNLNEDTVSASFEVSAVDGKLTRAAVDGDGAAGNVNRYVMEIYRKHDGITELFYRKVNSVRKGTGETKFDVTFLKNQEYDILFWADCGNGDADKYYVTTNGLKAVSFKGTYIGSNDEMDAFSNALSLKIGTEALPVRTVYLYRPFGQLNVITDDIKDLSSATVTSGHVICPDEIEVSYTAPGEFNVLTKKASGLKAFSYKTKPYYQTTGKESDSINQAMYTLSMDYILASEAGQDLHDIKVTSNCEGFKLNSNEFTNIPVQRNWRTNIIGSLLVVGGDFQVIVDPVWTGENDEEAL